MNVFQFVSDKGNSRKENLEKSYRIDLFAVASNPIQKYSVRFSLDFLLRIT